MSPTQTASCDKASARQAVENSDFPAAIEAALPADFLRGKPVLGEGNFVLSKVICWDLTGDGAEDMVVQLGCCTGSSPDPYAIFEEASGSWWLLFHRETDDISDLYREGSSLIEVQPVYQPGEPNCCPSSHQQFRVTWSGSEFVRAPAGTEGEGTGSEAGVADCPSTGAEPNIGNLSVRNMSCDDATAVIADFNSIATTFSVDGFTCGRISGQELGGTWRCTQGDKAFRFDFGD